MQAHDLTIKRHGGVSGIRDEGAIRGAIARPVNIALYEGEVTVGRLAAAVCVGIAKAHGFTDGNKRAALFALAMQLLILGYRLDATQKDMRDVIWSVADADCPLFRVLFNHNPACRAGPRIGAGRPVRVSTAGR
ncbi:type II toxin-antitoxin system death-on-curing family toxin [Ensifer sp. ENS10]|nr:type II toxin-antitoxin system death-on-curing family toxin [Ensifer sp. ENS10]MBV7517255.1 type II toxin-antitoxin system death-on-curing family toxin [Ensifer sp. ENS12]